MNASEIEQGMLIEGIGNQVREVVAIAKGRIGGSHVTYRQIHRGRGDASFPKVGAVGSMPLGTFAIWAVRDVTEEFAA